MKEFTYQRLMYYFKVLEKTGYYRYKEVEKLLVLLFYHIFLFEDYRGRLSKKDYYILERALNCLYGTCLIPYPDYLKMGKLKLGDITELSERTRHIEESMKGIEDAHNINVAQLKDNTRRIDEHSSNLDEINKTKVIKGKDFIKGIPDLDLDGIV